jgi:hypothetical protein
MVGPRAHFFVGIYGPLGRPIAIYGHIHRSFILGCQDPAIDCTIGEQNPAVSAGMYGYPRLGVPMVIRPETALFVRTPP